MQEQLAWSNCQPEPGAHGVGVQTQAQFASSNDQFGGHGFGVQMQAQLTRSTSKFSRQSGQTQPQLSGSGQQPSGHSTHVPWQRCMPLGQPQVHVAGSSGMPGGQVLAHGQVSFGAQQTPFWQICPDEQQAPPQQDSPGALQSGPGPSLRTSS